MSWTVREKGACLCNSRQCAQSTSCPDTRDAFFSILSIRNSLFQPSCFHCLPYLFPILRLASLCLPERRPFSFSFATYPRTVPTLGRTLFPLWYHFCFVPVALCALWLLAILHYFFDFPTPSCRFPCWPLRMRTVVVKRAPRVAQWLMRRVQPPAASLL